MARREHGRANRLLLGLIGVFGFVGYMVWALQSEDVFQVVEKNLEHTATGVVVNGTVKNTATTAASVSVEVLFFDSTGRQLATETITLENLAAGAMTSFRTQPQRLTDVANYTVFVSTGRNMYGN